MQNIYRSLCNGSIFRQFQMTFAIKPFIVLFQIHLLWKQLLNLKLKGKLPKEKQLEKFL